MTLAAPSGPDRDSLAGMLLARMRPLAAGLAAEFRTPGTIASFVVDDLFPEAVARRLAERFPGSGDMMRRSSLREAKYVSSQMDRHDPLLEEAVFGFQDERFVALLREITGIGDLAADPTLYASGLSLMAQGDFLNPHLDNSHDGPRANYRVLNVLYYASPGWREDWGGSLELWDAGPGGAPRPIASRFNRLVCMATHRGSWHSVSPVLAAAGRTCISNYYFSAAPLGDAEYFHVTSFRGRPGERVRDLALRADAWLRAAVRLVFPKGAAPLRHVYRRKRP